MGDKRRVTIIDLQIVLDGEVVLGEFNQLCVPRIRRVCLIGEEKYAPEVIVEGIQYTEMEIEKKGN